MKHRIACTSNFLSEKNERIKKVLSQKRLKIEFADQLKSIIRMSKFNPIEEVNKRKVTDGSGYLLSEKDIHLVKPGLIESIDKHFGGKVSIIKNGSLRITDPFEPAPPGGAIRYLTAKEFIQKIKDGK